MKMTITFQTGATGAFAMPAYGSAVAEPRKRPTHTGLEGVVALRSAIAASTDATTWNRADVPTPVPVRPGGATG